MGQKPDMKQIEKIEIPVCICREGTTLPFYANEGDAGMDIVAAEDVIIGPGCTKLVPTGIKAAIPPGYEIQIRPRSGLSLNTPLRIPNSPGTVDCGFRDEIKVIIENTSNPDSLNEEPCKSTLKTPIPVTSKGNAKGVYIIKKGDRIAQMVLGKVPSVKWTVKDDVERIGNNRGGGFGSTDNKNTEQKADNIV